jgi:hypothetical protein
MSLACAQDSPLTLPRRPTVLANSPDTSSASAGSWAAKMSAPTSRANASDTEILETLVGLDPGQSLPLGLCLDALVQPDSQVETTGNGSALK